MKIATSLILILSAAAMGQSTPPSASEARQRMEELNAKAAEQQRIQQAEELVALRAENARLKNELKAIGAQLAAAQEEISQLKAAAAQPATLPPAPVASPEPAPAAPKNIISAADLIAVYVANEIDGDARFKGREITITGVVERVATDFAGKPYVTIGSGKEFEVRQVQAMFAADEAKQLAGLKKGQEITIRGTVDGLMMNVLVRGCAIIP